MSEKRPVCAGVVLRNSKKEYLLVLGREHRKWSFPKGHIEGSETWQDCACRETLEETGLDVDIPENVKKCFTQKSVYFLLCSDNVKGELDLAPRDVNEIIEIDWFSKRKLLSMNRDDVNTDLWQFISALKWQY